MFCFRCLGGKAKRPCPVCKKRKNMELIEIERIDYLLATWYKLKKFNMLSTNCESLDKQVVAEWNDWRYHEEPNVV